jgi:hypothetical protein
MLNRNLALALGGLLVLLPTQAACTQEAEKAAPRVETDRAPLPPPESPVRVAQVSDEETPMPEGHPAMPQGHPAMPEGHPAAPQGHPGGMPTPHPPSAQEQAEAAHGSIDISGAAKQATVVVPESVQGHWKAATFVVVDRERSNAEEVTVDLDGEWTFPDGRLTIKVLEFLPDLRIDNKIYTSASNEPNNPAAHVVIHDGDHELFDGWLFSEFPQVHPFNHPRFGITLKEGVPI